MAELTVTYTTVKVIPGGVVPVAIGNQARTERIAIDSSSDGYESIQGGLAAQHGENAVVLYADTACWVQIGTNPTAAIDQDWFIPASTTREFSVEPGHKVAVSGV